MTTQDKIIDPRFTKILFTKEQIEARAKELAAQIDIDYKDKKPVLLVVLKGAVIWAGDLLSYLSLDAEVDFINISSYHGGVASSGRINLSQDTTIDLTDRDVLIIEDIVDTGTSLSYLKELLIDERGAKSARVVSMLDKKAVRKVEVEIEYAGFEIADEFIVGYGLDYKEIWRNIPFIGVIDQKALF
jgi:hypoxanthine phosphoribosyltransferase